MKILLDTNIVIWILEENPRFQKKYQHILNQNVDHVFYSFLNMFEIMLAKSKGRLDGFPSISRIQRGLIMSGFRKLPMDDYSLDIFATLPWHHKDPFDRLLIAQALHEDCTIMTSDPWFESYDVDVIKV